MSKESKPATALAALLLGIVALAHLLRAVLALPVVVGDQSIPISVSVVATVVAGALSLGIWRESRT